MSMPVIKITHRLLLILVLIVFVSVSSSSARAEFLGAIGGIAGVEEATVPPIQTMSGESTLSEGAGVVIVDYNYARGTRQFGEKIEDPSSEFQIPTSDPSRAKEQTERVFRLGYGITSKFNIAIVAPFIDVRSRFPQTTTGPAEEQHVSGIGNVNFSTKYQFSSRPNLAARLAVILPSGYEVGADYLQLQGDFAYSTKLGGFSLHAQGGYIWTGKDRQDLDHLDVLTGNLAITHPVGDHFVGDLELLSQFPMGRDDLEGVKYFNPPEQRNLDIVPGFAVQMSNNLSLATTVRISLINTLPVGYDYAYVVKVGYTF